MPMADCVASEESVITRNNKERDVRVCLKKCIGLRLCLTHFSRHGCAVVFVVVVGVVRMMAAMGDADVSPAL